MEPIVAAVEAARPIKHEHEFEFKVIVGQQSAIPFESTFSELRFKQQRQRSPQSQPQPPSTINVFYLR